MLLQKTKVKKCEPVNPFQQGVQKGRVGFSARDLSGNRGQDSLLSDSHL